MMRPPDVKLSKAEEASLARWRRGILALLIVTAAAMNAVNMFSGTPRYPRRPPSAGGERYQR
jgi:hypothetical protein